MVNFTLALEIEQFFDDIDIIILIIEIINNEYFTVWKMFDSNRGWSGYLINDIILDKQYNLWYICYKVIWLKHDETLRIAERLATGDTCRNIAKDCNTSPATVSRRANDPAIKQLIDKIREEHYQDNLQRAKDNFTHFIKNCTTTDNNNIRYLGFKASELTLQSAGVLTSRIQAYMSRTFTTITAPLLSAR